MGPFHCFFMDEISNGLDAPGTFAICKALCDYAHLWKVRIGSEDVLWG